ncbi:hypothetical protein ACNQKP_01165 [Bdellovibrio bacteriovorus]|uniref:hypothetical protein n=1 Tax=Bdellovibrio bacteriovorus TaxID=959 RepID=UPI003AA7C8FD
MKESELEGKGKGKYLVVLYQASQSVADNSCELVVIKVNGGVVGDRTVLHDSLSIGNCAFFEMRDLDGNGIEEALVTTVNLKAVENPPSIFHWNGRGFVEVTPVDSKKMNLLNSFLITDAKVGKSALMVGYSDEMAIPDRFTRTFILKDSKVSQLGVFDWYLFRKKAAALPEVDTGGFSLPAGDYTINVESRSADPTKAVRVEFKVGDNVIVKASDMCSGPAPKGYKPPNDGDGNEDKNKGCIARKSTYTVVKLTGKETFKMTVYGATGSMVDVSLKKK